MDSSVRPGQPEKAGESRNANAARIGPVRRAWIVGGALDRWWGIMLALQQWGIEVKPVGSDADLTALAAQAGGDGGVIVVDLLDNIDRGIAAITVLSILVLAGPHNCGACRAVGGAGATPAQSRGVSAGPSPARSCKDAGRARRGVSSRRTVACAVARAGRRSSSSTTTPTTAARCRPCCRARVLRFAARHRLRGVGYGGFRETGPDCIGHHDGEHVGRL